MDKSILLQKQVRENSEDLRSYLKDLQTWEEDMKRKESELNYNNDLPVGFQFKINVSNLYVLRIYDFNISGGSYSPN